MRLLNDPSYPEYREVAVEISDGRIGDEWIESAWSTMNLWACGSVETSPYGHPEPKALKISWMWKDGTLRVLVDRVIVL